MREIMFGDWIDIDREVEPNDLTRLRDDYFWQRDEHMIGVVEAFERLGHEQGRALFEQSRCAGCHGEGGKAADLASSSAAQDAVALATAMWNHAPEMHSLMGEQAVAWPVMERGDMRDLAAYLRSMASTAGGKDEGTKR